MKIYELIKARQVFEGVAKQKLPASTAWKVSKLLNKSAEDYKFYLERMSEIVRDYSLKDDEGNPVMEGDGFKINPELKDECVEKVKELEHVELDAPNVNFTLDELNCTTFSPAEINDIAFFIQEEQE